jgi:hypothetical protein
MCNWWNHKEKQEDDHHKVQRVVNQGLGEGDKESVMQKTLESLCDVSDALFFFT